jgi:6-phosphogluconolactonase
VQGEKNYTSTNPIIQKLRSTALHVFAHPLKTTTREDIQKEADRAIETLKRVRGEARFDLVAVSAGEDGHVASLFPRHIALKSAGKGYVIVPDAPKEPPVRITVTPALLVSARWGILLFEGGEKRVAYTRFLDTNVPTKECPAKLLLQLPELVVVAALGR